MPDRGAGRSDRAGRPTPQGGELLLTRRHFLFGALGVGAVAAIAGGTGVALSQAESPDDDLVVLDVPDASVTTSDGEGTLDLIENTEDRMTLVGDFELPYGTLVWSNDDEVAACLVPNEESAKPLARVGLLSLTTGDCPIVLERAVGQEDGFEIYDVRAVAGGIVWTEADILDGVWRVYTASSDGTSIGTPILVEEGTDEWETPTIAATENHAFWQILPRVDGPRRTEDSSLRRAAYGTDASETAYTSRGRMATPPYGLADSVVITPRADAASIYYELTRIDAGSGSVLDALTLPQSMKPLEAGYGGNGFMFSFDASYNFGGGIANLGTYTPSASVADGDYSAAPWFRFERAPSAAPAWCGAYFMVKSTGSVCAVDIDRGDYVVFDVPDGADSYGDYLASTGMNDVAVTFANIDYQPLEGDAVRCCRVRVWTPTA